MLPMQIGDGDTELPPQPLPGSRRAREEAEERSRRQNMIRTGVLMCLMMTIYDSSTATSVANRGSHQSNAAPGSKTALKEWDVGTTFSQRLNDLSNRDLRGSVPHNVTGMFSGRWNNPDSRLQNGQVSYALPWVPAPDEAQGHANSSTNTRSLRRLGLAPDAASASDRASWGDSAETAGDKPSEGRWELRLQSVPIPRVERVSYAYGLARFKGAGLRSVDITYPMQGVYFSDTGSLKLVASPFSDQELFLEVAADSAAGSAAGSAPGSAPGSAAGSAPDLEKAPTRRLSVQSVEGLGSSAWKSWSKSDFSEVVPSSLRPGLRYWLNSSARERDDPVDGGAAKRRRLELDEGSKSATPAQPVAKAALPSLQYRSRDTSGKIVNLTPSPYISSFNHNGAQMRLILGKHSEVVGHNGTKGMATPGMLLQSLDGPHVPNSFRAQQIGILNAELLGRQPVCQLEMDMVSSQYKTDKSGKPVRVIPLLPYSSSTGTSTHHLVVGDELLKTEDTFVSYMSGGAISRNCGTNYTASTQGFRLELDNLMSASSSYAIVVAAVCAMQIAALVTQLNYSSSQSGSVKVSIVGVCAQGVLDALMCVGHLLMSASIIPGLFIRDFMWISILKLVIFCVFQMRLTVNIFQARYSQEQSPEGFSGLRRRLATLHLHFYGAVFGVMFLALTFSNRPVVLVFLLYSFWIPQIVYNVAHGTRKALHPLYMYGMTFSRLFVPLYLYAYNGNFTTFMFIDDADEVVYNPNEACVLLVVWLLLQVGILFLQDKFGARFFVPKSLLPQRYDYYRALPSPRLGTSSEGSGSGSGSGSDSPSTLTNRGDVEAADLMECIICYNAIENVYGSYMVAPCDHVFHKACLTQWMDVKNECPTCRAALPIVDVEEE